MSENVECITCNKEVEIEKSWTLHGRDYENPARFCSDSCRTMFPFKKEVKENS